MSRGLKGIKVANLFKRKTELATALEIKNAGLAEQDLVDLSRSMLDLRQNYNLHPDTLRQLYSPLYTTTSPLVRDIYKQTLSQLGSTEDKHALTQSFLNSGSLELSTLSSDVLSDEKIVEALFCEGPVGSSVLRHAFLAGKWAPRKADHWHQLFKYAIESENYEFASKIWKSHYETNSSQAPPFLMARFLALASRQENAIRDLHFSTDLPASTALASAVLTNSMEKNDSAQTILKKVGDLVDFYENDLSSLNLSDCSHVADRLARFPLDVLEARPSHFVANLLLLGVYRHYTSQTVFHTYRYLVNHQEMKPDLWTAQILANSAFRLGNSKLLGYEIWRETTPVIKPTRKFCETMLMCQLVGTGYKSSLFFLQEMYTRNIYLRSHIQRMLSNKFAKIGDEQTFVNLFQSPHIGKELTNYLKFDLELAKEESGTYLAQAERNASIFVEGRTPEKDPLTTLSRMLEFEAKLKST